MQERFIDADGIRTFCIEAGAGPCLVLMHGGGIAIDARLTWFDNIEPLAEHFHVIAFDQVGFGKSGMPGDPAAFTKLYRAQHALAVLDALGVRRAILAGHSEGGFIASKIAVDHPERVETLVIVASGATAPRLEGERGEAVRKASEAAYDWELEASSEEAFVAHFTRSMLYHPDRIPEERLVANHREARRSGNMDLYLNLPPELGDEERYYATARRHVHPRLPALAVPSLLVWANNDPTVPVERGLALLEMLPGAEMHVFDRAKHMVMIDAARGFNRLLAGLR